MNLITKRLSYGYFNIMRARQLNVQGKDLLPLYRSKTLAKSSRSNALSTMMQHKLFAKTYREYLPMMIQNALGFYTERNLVSEMFFQPQSQALVVRVLRPTGILQQNLDIKNMVPWTYGDLLNSSSAVGFKLPFSLDPEMIYFNTFLRQIYLFEKSGDWHEENAKHPKLSLEALYNEKTWHDRYKIF